MKKRVLPLLFALLALSTPSAAADSFEQAGQDIDDRLEGSLRELGEVREKIAREKLPLSVKVSSLEDEVVTLRRDRARRLEVHDSRGIDLSSLRAEVGSLESQQEFIKSRLNEFVREFEARLDVSELPEYEERTIAARLADKNANLDAEGRRSAQIDVVDAALGRLGKQLGGQVYDGEALSADGVLTKGRFVSLGPTVFYVSTDAEVAGLVEAQLNAAHPVVVPLPGGIGGGIAQLANGEPGRLPLDSTLGKALKREKARKTTTEYIAQGGVVGYVIVGLGLAALALTAFKCFEILGFVVAPAGEVDVVLGELSKGDVESAGSQAGRVDGVAGDILATGVAHWSERRGVLEELLFEKILKVRPALERFLPFLAITAAAAPLLGLLGTVIGMIETFQLITIFGTGDAKSLSSGISEALITTALGLIVAIPTLILHGALSRMAKRKLGLLEELSVAFVNGVATIQSSLERRDPAVGPGVAGAHE